MTRTRIPILTGLGTLLGLCAPSFEASDWDELKVKRQEVFEFERKPVITRRGDQVEIAFTAKSFCDTTIAIEDEQGK